MWNDICLNLPSFCYCKGSKVWKSRSNFFKIGGWAFNRIPIFSEYVLKIGWFLPIFRGWAFIKVWASIRIFTVVLHGRRQGCSQMRRRWTHVPCRSNNFNSLNYPKHNFIDFGGKTGTLIVDSISNLFKTDHSYTRYVL